MTTIEKIDNALQSGEPQAIFTIIPEVRYTLGDDEADHLTDVARKLERESWCGYDAVLDTQS